MSLALSALEVIGTMTATGFAAWQGENLLIRAGLMKSPIGYEVSTRPKAPPPLPEPPFNPFEEMLRSQVRENARLYALNPLAFWLAPDEIDAPFLVPSKKGFDTAAYVKGLSPPNQGSGGKTYAQNAREMARVAKARKTAIPPPPCPGCGRKSLAEIHVTADHDGYPSMWECERCNTEYTLAGETKASAKRRKAAEQEDYAFTLPMPPAIVPYNPQATMRMTQDPETLPCGCPGSGGIERAGWYSKCDRCKAWWEPASNDPSGRRLAQGEKVHDRYRRERAWERRGEAVMSGKAENNGSCPEPCGFPVDKRGGMYYCSDPGCHRHKEGWK